MCEICDVKCRLVSSKIKKSGRIDLIADDGFTYHFWGGNDEIVKKSIDLKSPVNILCSDYLFKITEAEK